MKQITIYDLLPLLKKGWVAMDEDGIWVWYNEKPICCINGRWGVFGDADAFQLYSFDIAPFDGDWKDSLIKVEHKEEE
ncbi:MAG: hypothetical protein J6S67_25930 [Methanobrevibacter sp.]|nr:hypothetical protein [Methanobrevibacter sp.]